MYPEIGRLVEELVARKKYVYLCTNAILLKEKLEAGLFTPSKYLSFSIHMDGLREEHDEAVCKDGRVRPGGRGDPRGARPRLPRDDQHDALRGRQPRAGAAVLRRDDGPRRRGDDGLAGLQLLEGARPGALPPQAAGARAVPHGSCRARSGAGASTSRRCSCSSSWGSATTSARPGGTRPTTSSAGSGPCYLLQEGYAQELPGPDGRDPLGALREAERQRRSAATAWSTAGSRRPPSRRPSPAGAASATRWSPRSPAGVCSLMEVEKSLEGWDARAGRRALARSHHRPGLRLPRQHDGHPAGRGELDGLRVQPRRGGGRRPISRCSTARAGDPIASRTRTSAPSTSPGRTPRPGSRTRPG